MNRKNIIITDANYDYCKTIIEPNVAVDCSSTIKNYKMA